MEARLQAVTGPLEGSTIALPEGEFRLGRHISNDLSLSDTLVSRYHCEIRFRDGQFALLDLSSQNGTFVNGQRVGEHVLADGDQIAIGRSIFHYRSLALEEPPPLPDDGPIVRTTMVLRPEDSRYLRAHDLLRSGGSDRTARNLQALIRVATTIHSVRGLQGMCTELLTVILDVVPAGRGAILLAEPDHGLRSICSRNRDTGQAVELPISRAVARRAIQDGTALLVEDALEDDAFSPTESIVAAHTTSILAVPLNVHDRVLGLIYLDATFRAAFSDDHLEMVSAIASPAAIAIENAMHVEWLEQELRRTSPQSTNFIGDSPAMQKVMALLTRVAPTDSTVLLEGESGTGKEVAARALHQLSRRSRKPFVALNCAALAPNLVEAELFGYDKGAFTGATARKEGKIEAAQGGTLFLDEVGEMDVSLQAKLLRVLQNREFQRLGSNQNLTADVRIIAATNRELKAAIAEGRFREDLYFRLNVFPIRMPPLRERRADIAALANHFVEKSCEKIGRPPLKISREAQKLLLAYDWPGNVRELENACERATVLCSGATIQPEDLPETLLECGESGGTSLANYHEAVNDFKKDLVIRTIEQASGSYADAARILGLHPNNLHRLIRNLGIKESLRTDS